MLCPKCGTTNSEGFKFCIKCGNSLETTTQNVVELVTTEEIFTEQSVEVAPTQSVEATAAPFQQPMNTYQQTVQSQQSFNTSTVSAVLTDNSPLNYLKYVLGLLLKPFETYKSEEGKLSNVKNSLILSGIVAGAMMLINLLTAMISSVFVKTMDFSTFKYKTEFNIEGLKNLDYLDLIVKNFLIYVCIIGVIAVVYYLASLVAKKSINFMKFVSISASSLIPYVILGMVISPILGKIWVPLSIVSTILGLVYSVILFVLLISDNIKFEKKDLYAYFHLVCMTILGTTGYYAYMKLFTSGITDQLGSYLDMFK